MKITVVGTGYVGLVSGVCFAEFGFDVTCVDIDEAKIEQLKLGKSPIYEPGLEDMIASNMSSGRLRFTTNLEKAVGNSDIIFIAVGTPENEQTGEADLKYIYEAAKQIANATKKYALIVTKSTVPVGTGDEIARIVEEESKTAKFDIASNPEFLKEGSAINDFMRPDRIVIGVESEQAAKWLRQIYRPLTRHHIPLVETGRKTAEMIKYASNSFLATKVAFINEMADICENVGANVEEVAYGMGLDNRIGERFLRAGPGFGGSCFPKDVKALSFIANNNNAESHIIEAVIKSNDKRKHNMAAKIIEANGGGVKGKVIAILGLTFKPGTDDMRESPALVIIPELIKAGATIKTYDPEGMDNAKELLKSDKITWEKNEYDCMKNANSLCIMTEWNSFKALDLQKAKELMLTPIIIDLRNIYKREQMKEAGFSYVSIGREDI